MSSLQPSNPTTIGLENSNIDEEQDKDLNKVFMTMLEVLKKEMHKKPLKKSMKIQPVSGRQ